MPVVRPYESRDLEACRALWVELTEWHREIYAAPTIGGDDPGAQFDEHLARVGAERLWVAEEDGRVVGLTGLIHDDETTEVEPVVVSRELRGSGVGRQLVETVIAAAREAGIKQLAVRPVGRNANAIRFFGAMGFGTIGHIQLFMDFGDPEGSKWRAGEEIAGCEFTV